MNETVTITNANPHQADAIARLIMQAMNYDCCQFFAGKNHSLDDFHATMSRLVAARDTQYSYENTIVATNSDGKVIGIAVSYDGGQLHMLRKAFIVAAKNDFGQDFSNIDDETSDGEHYIDSLAVDKSERGKGIATELLKAVIEKAKHLNMPAVGLLVDKGNPQAERLYQRLGFCHVNDTTWGGHPMRHLQLPIVNQKKP